jgi:hypothetical protein
VLNLHGGYFSFLLAGKLGEGALTGVSHGPEFGEYRPVIPVGGGIPIARYYIPDLHSRIRYRDALRWFREKGWLISAEVFHSEVCNCDTCRDTIRNDPNNFVLFGESNVKNVGRGGGIVRINFPKTEAKKRCLEHYLRRKDKEFQSATNAPGEFLLEEMVKGIEKYKTVAGLEEVSHLQKWIDVLVS